MPSDSGFIAPEQFSHEWQNIRILQKRRDNIVYLAERYGRCFLLKALQPNCAELTEYRLQQEKEFRLGISLSHPNIVTIYSLEEIPNIGRCIVQEWIDGITIQQWMESNPSLQSRKRAWEQLLNALAYLHANQRVHHDIKPSNILITRNGQNVKLIDFGLSDSDDSTNTPQQDANDDIKRLVPIIRLLFPNRYSCMIKHCEKGTYPNITALQKAWIRRKNIRKSLPLILSVLLLLLASILLAIAYQQRNADRIKQEQMYERVEEAFEKHATRLQIATHNAATGQEALIEITRIAQEGWKVRDSIIALYPENDPMRVLVFDLWTQRAGSIQTELMKTAQSKPFSN